MGGGVPTSAGSESRRAAFCVWNIITSSQSTRPTLKSRFIWNALPQLWPVFAGTWFTPFVEKLLEGDPAILGLLRINPFPDRPPRFIRAELFRYTFTTEQEHRRTGLWWNIPRNLGYLHGLTSEVRARAEMHQPNAGTRVDR